MTTTISKKHKNKWQIWLKTFIDFWSLNIWQYLEVLTVSGLPKKDFNFKQTKISINYFISYIVFIIKSNKNNSSTLNDTMKTSHQME